jgi:hypothetical protein
LKLTACPYEKDLRDLIHRGQWPVAAAAHPEILAHLSACRACSDLALVSGAFQSARAATLAAAMPVSPGILLWRAQLRRRNTAIERLSRPLLGAQMFALAVTLLAALGFTVFEARHGVGWLTWIEQLPQSAALQWQDLLTSSPLSGQGWSVLFPALATLALLGGVVVYLAADKN